MSKHNLGNPELEALATYKGASAVIMGYLVRERGVIAPAPFNKLFTELGYERMNKDEISEVATDINGDGTLVYLYDLARDGKLHLQDIPNAQGEGEKLTEEDVFSIVTPYIEQKEDQASKLREFRKMQRDGTAMQLLFNKLKQSLLEELKDIPRAKHITSDLKPLQRGDKALILCFSDWHVGVKVFNEKTGGYDFQKLINYSNSIVDETLRLVEDFGIKHLYVYNLGDLVEHVGMRNINQAFDAEMNLSEQIASATRLTVEILGKLSKHVHVTYTQIAGNHDRLQVSKNDVITNDSTAYILLSTLIMLQDDLGQLPNVTITDNRDYMYSHTQTIAGLTVKAVHGDKEKRGLSPSIPKHIKDHPIDLLLMGHFHSTLIKQEDYARFSIVVGSTQGENDFSKDLNLPSTYASQMFIFLEEGKKSPMFYPVVLKNGGII